LVHSEARALPRWVWRTGIGEVYGPTPAYGCDGGPEGAGWCGAACGGICGGPPCGGPCGGTGAWYCCWYGVVIGRPRCRSWSDRRGRTAPRAAEPGEWREPGESRGPPEPPG